MIDVLFLLEKRLPPGFVLSFTQCRLGIRIKFSYGRIESSMDISYHMLNDISPELQQILNKEVFDDQIAKIRNHPKFSRQKINM